MTLPKEISLSVLDFGESIEPCEDIHEVIKYAVAAEELGYKRFWMGEHYMKNTLFSNPEPLIPIIAAMTNRISVGTAGLLIRQHSVFRLACSFSLLEKMFPERIDLGLVAPSGKIDAIGKPLKKLKSVKEIFHEFLNHYTGGSDEPGIYIGSTPSMWHLTSSIKTFNASQHCPAVNVSKSLFHQSSNFDPELSELAILEERRQQDDTYRPRVTIAIGCYVTFAKKKIIKYRKFYRASLSHEVYRMCIIEHPSSFLERLREIALKYHTNDIIILNLGRCYQAKTECLETISDLLNLKNASES